MSNEKCFACGEELCTDEGFEEHEICDDCRDSAGDLEDLLAMALAKNENFTDAKRGIPCEHCNNPKSGI